MACKIKKEENSIEGGNRSYFIVTFDFSSLEARLAAIDTCLNAQGIDPVLKDIYKDGAAGDLHSMTGFNTFFKGQKAMHVHDDVDNKDWVFHPDAKVKVVRGNGELAIFAHELQVNDHILEQLEK